MKIALLQTAVAWENKPLNIRQVEAMLHALPDDVRLAVLPEMFTTGFSMQPTALAESEHGDTLQWMRQTATGRKIALVGSIIAEEGGNYFNRLFFVFPDGSYQKYDKRHLFSMAGETEHYTAGSQRLIVEYEGWRICPLICYDVRFPVWSRNYGDRYDLLLYVANFPATRMQVWNTLLAARAIENQCYVAGVNRCGMDGAGVAHSGASQVVDFKGNRIAVAGDTESSLTVTLSLVGLRAFREKFPAWRDADAFVVR
jgi:predicted amidohydrolase